MVDTKPIAGAKQDEDLRYNPGIGQSSGTYATDEEPEQGENTREGDVENDPDATGAVNADRLGRTNK